MTTLTEARRALLKLVDAFPAQSTYATQLAVLSDYFDNQVPLNIENQNLLARVAVAEAFRQRVSELLQPTAADNTDRGPVMLTGYPPCEHFAKRARQDDPVELTKPSQKAVEHAVRGAEPFDCTAYLGGNWRCDCTCCRVRANA